MFLFHLNLFAIFSIILNIFILTKLYSLIDNTDKTTIDISINNTANATIVEDIENIGDIKTTSYVYIGLTIGTIVFVFLFVFIFIGKLFLLHAWLCSQNFTFYEYIKNKFSGVPFGNPYNTRNNKIKTFFYLLCSKKPKQHLKIYLKKIRANVEKEPEINKESNDKRNDNNDYNRNHSNNIPFVYNDMNKINFNKVQYNFDKEDLNITNTPNNEINLNSRNSENKLGFNINSNSDSKFPSNNLFNINNINDKFEYNSNIKNELKYINIKKLQKDGGNGKYFSKDFYNSNVNSNINLNVNCMPSSERNINSLSVKSKNDNSSHSSKCNSKSSGSSSKNSISLNNFNNDVNIEKRNINDIPKICNKKNKKRFFSISVKEN